MRAGSRPRTRGGLTAPAGVIGQMVVAVLIASVVAGVSITAIARVQWPAYNTSNQLHALTTVGQFGCLAGIFASGLIWRRGRRTLARLAALIFLSAFSVVTLAMPLGATKLYLFGVSVDQQFRTEYLTRLTDSPGLHDMTYFGLPPYYPAGWFWMGGRIAAGTGAPAWEMFKPWAISSITIAAALALVLWAAMVRFEYALIVTTASTAAMLAYSTTEPYAAIITVLLPPVLVLAWSGLRGRSRNGGWAAIIGTGIFLGVAALFYTLLFVYCAFTLAIMGMLLAAARRHWDPLLRLVVIAAISGLIALISWAPYLLAAAKGHPADKGTAQHYLPDAGAQLTFPMLSFTLLGALCMVGTLWLVVRARTSTRAAALAFGVLAIYAWSLLSMLTTLVGTTLLSFRLQSMLTVLLTTAGAFGFIEATLAIARRYQPETRRRIIAVAATIGTIGGLTFSQDIPDVLRPDINVAYTDTDGTGVRADRRPPGAEQYYRAVDAKILEVTGVPRNQTVVLTADYSFLSYYPYYGFQGLTSHYANPLAQFKERAGTIEGWGTLSTADQFIKALDELPWKAPTVFLMRRGAGDTYTLRLASDVYPNQPNVRRYHVELNSALFHDPRFDLSDVGPFVLAIRKPDQKATPDGR
ncbi:arabinofuranosyltransferase [Mycobacterium dioxanotrophicus]|uniref:Galactan 5-O-arabinofuranosyltransferase n=1 Tax=Mycobacterium dioxanotrophicus TaxID=482462 RepID=A0A1Y0BXH1_9MYCO|nr:galactan 5-O-arabinofuranosyltransferase [Mycobacterium dioxanotrophicus]ART67587.1 arabinofuranosyltransferase [Mycobacterium dioxanotrophicus]